MKRLALPGGSFLDVDDRDPQREAERDQREFDDKRLEGFVSLLENEIADPEAFADDLRRNVDPQLGDHLRGNENVSAEHFLERRARPSIFAGLQKDYQEALSQEAINQTQGTLGQLLDPHGRAFEDDQ
jgi:hypothetical protein